MHADTSDSKYDKMEQTCAFGARLWHGMYFSKYFKLPKFYRRGQYKYETLMSFLFLCDIDIYVKFKKIPAWQPGG